MRNWAISLVEARDKKSVGYFTLRSPRMICQEVGTDRLRRQHDGRVAIQADFVVRTRHMN